MKNCMTCERCEICPVLKLWIELNDSPIVATTFYCSEYKLDKSLQEIKG
jgi:hypothetical protein